jgi:hypothetical protein
MNTFARTTGNRKVLWDFYLGATHAKHFDMGQGPDIQDVVLCGKRIVADGQNPVGQLQGSSPDKHKNFFGFLSWNRTE